MFYIDSETNDLYLTRGDTASLDLDLFIDDTPYTMVTGDKIVFSLRRNNDFNYACLNKEVTAPHIDFVTDDTNNNSLGEYEYSITMFYNDGNIDTFLTGKFHILGRCYV